MYVFLIIMHVNMLNNVMFFFFKKMENNWCTCSSHSAFIMVLIFIFILNKMIKRQAQKKYKSPRFESHAKTNSITIQVHKNISNKLDKIRFCNFVHV